MNARYDVITKYFSKWNLRNREATITRGQKTDLISKEYCLIYREKH